MEDFSVCILCLPFQLQGSHCQNKNVMSFFQAKHGHLLVTVRKVVVARLCFHRRLWFYSRGGEECGRHPVGQTPPCPVHAGIHPQVHAGIHTSPAQCMLGYTPPRRPLQRTVRILLECILVLYYKISNNIEIYQEPVQWIMKIFLHTFKFKAGENRY